MGSVRVKQLLPVLFTVLLVALIGMGLFFFSQLLKADTGLLPLAFTVRDQHRNYDEVALRGTFDREIPSGETLWLYAENAEVQLSFDDVRFRCNTKKDVPPIFRSPGSGWFAFRSPGIAAGKTVELSICSYYDANEAASTHLLSRLYTGDGSGLYRLMLGQFGFFELIQAIALVAGLIYIGEGAIDVASGISLDGVRIGIFGFYCLSGGLWSITDAVYPYFSLIVSPTWAASIVDMSGLLLFPIALAAMMRYYMRSKHTRRVMSGILLIEIIVAAACLLIQLAGVADLVEQQTVIGMVALSALSVAVCCVIVELNHYRDGYLLLLLLTVLPVFIAILIEGINVLWCFMPRRVCMQYSFGISVLLLVLQLESYARVLLGKTEKLHQIESELIESQIANMFSQIKPHFLYNSLLGIKQLCDTEPRKASDALEHFAYYLRGNLYFVSDSKLIPFKKELDHVQDYLYLEKMRFEERVNICWRIDFTDFLIPPLTLQPIVENAVRHGLTKKEEGGTITIRSERTKDAILITVADDGAGFDTTRAIDDSRPHIGLKNVKKRLNTQCGGSLQIHSEPGTGTEIKIVLPRKEHAHEDISSR